MNPASLASEAALHSGRSSMQISNHEVNTACSNCVLVDDRLVIFECHLTLIFRIFLKGHILIGQM